MQLEALSAERRHRLALEALAHPCSCDDAMFLVAQTKRKAGRSPECNSSLALPGRPEMNTPVWWLHMGTKLSRT